MSFRHISSDKAFAKRFVLTRTCGFALLFENAGKFFVAYSAKEAKAMRAASFAPVSILG